MDETYNKLKYPKSILSIGVKMTGSYNPAVFSMFRRLGHGEVKSMRCAALLRQVFYFGYECNPETNNGWMSQSRENMARSVFCSVREVIRLTAELESMGLLQIKRLLSKVKRTHYRTEYRVNIERVNKFCTLKNRAEMVGQIKKFKKEMEEYDEILSSIGS